MSLFLFQIFHGRQGFRELTEFTEDLLKIVKSYTLKHNKMGIRAAAIYLWYTLYFKQPTRPKVRLHVDKREYSDLNKFLKQCREERHWEIVYCWSKLIGKPFTNHSVRNLHFLSKNSTLISRENCRFFG